MKPRRGAAIALTGGLGVAAVLGAGIAFRKDIAAAWHLHRLQTDEAYLERILDAPEGSAANLAVRRWAEMPPGREAVFVIFEEEAIGNIPDRLDPDTEQVVFVVKTFDKVDAHNLNGAYRPRGMSSGGGWVAGVNGDQQRLRAVIRYLPALAGRDFASTRHPRFRFRIVDPIEGFQLLGIDFRQFFGRLPEEGEPACLLERLPDEPSLGPGSAR